MAEQQRYPMLLSNGNRAGQRCRRPGPPLGHLARSRSRSRAYLFALVAGDLWCVEDSLHHHAPA